MHELGLTLSVQNQELEWMIINMLYPSFDECVPNTFIIYN